MDVNLYGVLLGCQYAGRHMKENGGGSIINNSSIAGIMGGGIAQLLSDRGVWARLKDINQDAIAKGLKAAYDVYAQAMFMLEVMKKSVR